MPQTEGSTIPTVSTLGLAVTIEHPATRRRAALLAGTTLPSHERRDISLSPADPSWARWVERATIRPYNDPILDLHLTYEADPDPGVPIPSPAALLAILDERITAKEVERERDQAARAAKLAADAAAYLSGHPEADPYPVADLDAATQEKVRAESERRAKAKSDAERRAWEASKARDVARLDRLEALAREHGDESVRERLDADASLALGLLPESEALEVVRAALLPLNPQIGLAPYVPLKPADHQCPCRDEDDYCEGPSDVSFRSGVDAEVSRGTWESTKEVRAALAAFGVTEPGVIRFHAADCPVEGHPTTFRSGLLVVRDLGDGLEIRREYALEGGAS